ncbi:MAG: NAD(P)-binding domain-containing protein [Gordonia sp. (in: high G+C Gram-positive bacteria)]|uniref:NAD(P)-dependent oxidoreductase n=1 Tax=Gordonia sp. (in: high G+C Gram-positive bacteria) TaxID=84139 RepID=UPI003C795B90
MSDEVNARSEMRCDSHRRATQDGDIPIWSESPSSMRVILSTRGFDADAAQIRHPGTTPNTRLIRPSLGLRPAQVKEGDSLTTSASSTTVSVLGTGNMGSAIVRTLLASGHRVVAWNRTAEKARPLVEHGAEVVSAVADAVHDADLTIVCLATTDATRETLGGVAEHLAGRDVLNLTTGTPDDATSVSDWATQAGIRYLDGVIAAYPHQLGAVDARILVSGDAELWERHREVVIALAGSSTHVGENPSAGNVIDAGLTGAFYMSSLVAFVEATRFMNAAGVSNTTIAEQVEYATAVLAHQMLDALRQIDAQDFETDQATVDVFAHTSAAFAHGMGAVGDASMITATADLFARAARAGLGEKSLAALHMLSSN